MLDHALGTWLTRYSTTPCDRGYSSDRMRDFGEAWRRALARFGLTSAARRLSTGRVLSACGFIIAAAAGVRMAENAPAVVVALGWVGSCACFVVSAMLKRDETG